MLEMVEPVAELSLKEYEACRKLKCLVLNMRDIHTYYSLTGLELRKKAILIENNS